MFVIKSQRRSLFTKLWRPVALVTSIHLGLVSEVQAKVKEDYINQVVSLWGHHHSCRHVRFYYMYPITLYFSSVKAKIYPWSKIAWWVNPNLQFAKINWCSSKLSYRPLVWTAFEKAYKDDLQTNMKAQFDSFAVLANFKTLLIPETFYHVYECPSPGIFCTWRYQNFSLM